MILGEHVKDGKKIVMPPGKRDRLAPAAIATITAWVDGGALAPSRPIERELRLKPVPTEAPVVSPIHALASSPDGTHLAVGTYKRVNLVETETRSVLKTTPLHGGAVNAVIFSKDGTHVYAGGGQPGLEGEILIWNPSSTNAAQILKGHSDAVYTLALSPDGLTLASGSYDQKIKLWDLRSGREKQTLTGHNGAVLDLAFRPDGKVLASASADRTVKLWDVETGERRDTLSQPLKEVNSLAFSPDGLRLAAAGADNRIRLWNISEKATETTNPLIESRFAHEGSVLRLRFDPDGKSLLSSAEDGTVKLWSPTELKELLALEKQKDWPTAISYVGGGAKFAIGRADGSLDLFTKADGKRVLPAKPEVLGVFPRAAQRGTKTFVRLSGRHLTSIQSVMTSAPGIEASVATNLFATSDQAWIEVRSRENSALGSFELSVATSHADSAKFKLELDALPQRTRDTTNDHTSVSLPSCYWGLASKAGTVEEIRFSAKKGERIVIEAAARGLGSSMSPDLRLFTASGELLTILHGTETEDPITVFSPQQDGVYHLRISDRMASGSPSHFFRLTIGQVPFVTGLFPSNFQAGKEGSARLLGYNLDASNEVLSIPAGPVGEATIPLDPSRFRSRKELRITRTLSQDKMEQEPNDTVAAAMRIEAPESVSGSLFLTRDGSTVADVDYYQFSSRKGARWILETHAARWGSSADTRIEVLDEAGRSIDQVILQAVRDSAITFRGIDSETRDCRVDNWEEMELTQYLYIEGEVVRLYRAPQGPDSGFQFFGSKDKRLTYFGTSPTAHANEERCYIVEAHPPGTQLPPNGLPTFRVPYANDDDSERKLGKDSRLGFIAPHDGKFLVRVSDSRGLSKATSTYRLVLRESKPDFAVKLAPQELSVPLQGGREFTLTAERIDDFEGEITVTIEGVPEGFTISTPLVIQAGHLEAKGTITASPTAQNPAMVELSNIRWIASAKVDGTLQTKPITGFTALKVEPRSKLHIFMAALENQATPTASEQDPKAGPVVITLAPGATTSAWLAVELNGHTDLTTFSVENLPHGVIVDNIGLNGVLLPKGETARQIFLRAERWVPETDRLCYAVANQAGRPTSRPVMIQIRKTQAQPPKQVGAVK